MLYLKHPCLPITKVVTFLKYDKLLRKFFRIAKDFIALISLSAYTPSFITIIGAKLFSKNKNSPICVGEHIRFLVYR